ncbi:MAG: hypothetical protein FWG57_06565 [Endomicrobia bacterium]|nr:hypothetical protein [Endomicrobiia bacterium]
MRKYAIPDFIKEHLTFFIFLLSFLTVLAVYPSINKYTYLIFFFISILYCLYIFFKQFKYTKTVLLFSVLLFISLFYCSITYTSFYPERTKIKKSITISGFTGWGYYNFLAYGLKNKQLNIPVEPSEKLKALNNPYDYMELNDNLSWQNFEYVLDLSFYKGKYYIYFGVVPALTVYLPFMLLTNSFITDALVVLLFALLSFYLSVFIFFGIYRKFVEKKDFLFEVMAVMAIGLCSSFAFLISFPRVYEVAIIMAVFFCLLSFLFIYLHARKKKNIFLFLAGLFIGLACGCRPFYALAVPLQFFIIFDLKTMRQSWKGYVFYAVPVAVCAAGLMLYNYARFDSVFEFGTKYQLTIYDMFHWKPSLSNMWNSLRNFLFLSPEYKNSFPYIFSRLSSGMWHKFEPVTGILYLMPFVFMFPLGYLFFKEKGVESFYKKYIAGMILTGVIILFSVSLMGSLYRFLADFSIYLIISSLFLAAYWCSKYQEKLSGLIIKYALITTVFLGIVLSFSLSVSNALMLSVINMPELYARMASLF